MVRVPSVITGSPGDPSARISVIVDKRFKSFALDSEVGKKLAAAVAAGESQETIREIASEDLWVIARTLGASGKVIIDDRDQIRLDGRLVDYGLAGVLKRLAKDADARLEDVSAFLAKVDQNPDKSVANDLYRFLEKGNLPITPEGDFMAFKNIKDDFWSFGTGSEPTFTKDANGEETSNTGQAHYPIGSTVWMKREDCDSRRNVTCSHGLHACSYEYLPSFHGGQGKTIIVRIDPADVTAIPTDYNETKLRCCRMEVLDEIPYAEAKDYFKSAVDRRHPVAAPVAPEPEPVPEVAPDWRLLGVVDGEAAASSDHDNGYPYGPQIDSWPAALEVEAGDEAPFDVTQARQDFSRGFFEGYESGWNEAEDGGLDEEAPSKPSEAEVIAWGDLDGRRQAEGTFGSEYDPDHWTDRFEGYDGENVSESEFSEAYKIAFYKGYAERWAELQAEKDNQP
jgi:hypothetical protein